MPRLFLTCVASLLAAGAMAVAVASRPTRASSSESARPLASASPDGPVPVIVELFTSEGCSSCPAADDVLTRLTAEQPVDGAVIIPLSEHVDYWDRLGWRDPFSSSTFSARQSEYDNKAFHSGSIYTPQMIVDGEVQFVGSDYRRATAAITAAARRAKAPLNLSIEGRVHNGEPSSLHIGLRAPNGLSASVPVVVMVAVTEDGLSTAVRRGENGGRELHHSAVVRSLIQVGTVKGGSAPWSTGATVPIASDWNANRLHLVAFAQEPNSRQVVAAARLVIGS